MGISKNHLFQIALIFLITRGLVFGLGVYNYSIFPERGEKYQKRELSEVTSLETVWKRWDSDWFEKLAQDGYPQKPFSDQVQETWGFMPLYSILMAGLSCLSGLSLFASGMLISNVCTFMLLLVLYKLAEEKYAKGIEAITLLLISAGSFYLSIVYSEGLFVLLSALVFYFTHKKWLGWALIVAGLASVTRIQGCLLFVIPGIELIMTYRRDLFRYIPWMLASLLPMALFMGYLYQSCGEPLAFIKIQNAWGSEALMPLLGFSGLFRGVRTGGSLVHAFYWLMILGLTLSCYRKLPLSYVIFTVLYFLLSTSNTSLFGSTRYMLGVIPVFLAVNLSTDHIRNIFIAVNLTLLTLMIADFVTNSFVFL